MKHNVAPAPSYSLVRPGERNSELLRLKRQALVPFSLEWSALKKHEFQAGGRLLDLGPGAGAYLALIVTKAPHLHVSGIEADRELADICSKRLPLADIRCADATNPEALGIALKEFGPDIVMARYLLQHLSLSARARLLDAIRVGLTPTQRFICIDADDALFLIDPPHAAFSRLNRRLADWQASLEGDRFIGRKLSAILEAHGFTDVRATPVVISSQEVGLRNWWEAYGPAYRRSFHDFEGSERDPDYLAAESWITTYANDRAVWISKILHIVSGVGSRQAA